MSSLISNYHLIIYIYDTIVQKIITLDNQIKINLKNNILINMSVTYRVKKISKNHVSACPTCIVSLVRVSAS